MSKSWRGIMACMSAFGLATLAMTCAPEARAQAQAVKQVKALTPLPFPMDAASPRTSLVKRVRSTFARNERIGELQEGVFCGSKGNIVFNDKVWEGVSRPLGRLYREELERAGYPVPRGSDSAFADSTKPQVADLDVGITIRRVQGNFCLRNPQSLQGQAYVEVRYELYSPQARKVVLDVTTEGYFQYPEDYRMGNDGLFGEPLRISIRNLMADPRLAAWLSGSNPLPPPEAVVAEMVKVRGQKAVPQPTAANVTTLRAAVATVVTASGTGSGFFVSPDGYLVTNQHVVGTDKFVKIKLATGRELAGEVLRSDATRDVALVKTEPVAFPVLAVRGGEANVGEDVFVIGSPLGEAFGGSLTKGVLSGHRLLNDLRYIQSDASILPGSSGGPLLDGNGAVIGMTVKGVRAAVGNLGLFIPIGDALAKLGVELQP